MGTFVLLDSWFKNLSKIERPTSEKTHKRSIKYVVLVGFETFILLELKQALVEAYKLMSVIDR